MPTAPIAVSGRGGPQPAKRSPIEDVVQNGVNQALAALPQPNSPADVIAQAKAADAAPALPGTSLSASSGWSSKPTPQTLLDWLNADHQNPDLGGGSGGGLFIGPPSGRSDTSAVGDSVYAQYDTPDKVAALLSGVNNQGELEQKLGLQPNALDTLIGASDQQSMARSTAHKAIDQQVARAVAQAGGGGGGSTPPASSTPNPAYESIDLFPKDASGNPVVPSAMQRGNVDGNGKWTNDPNGSYVFVPDETVPVNAPPAAPVDPMSLAKPAPLSSQDLQQLILQMHAQATDQLPAQLDAAKNTIISDTQTAIARDAQISDAYQAGLKGAPIPAVPTSGPAVTQTRYEVANPQHPDVFTPTVRLGELDTTPTDEAILHAAQLVTQKQQTEQAYQAHAQLTDLLGQQKQAEADAAAVGKEQTKLATNAAAREAQKQWDAQTQGLYADALSSAAVAAAAKDQGSVPAARSTYNTLRDALRSGANVQDAISAAFDGAVSSDLTNGQMKLVQAARVAAGTVPSELSADYGHFADQRRAAQTAAKGTGG